MNDQVRKPALACFLSFVLCLSVSRPVQAGVGLGLGLGFGPFALGLDIPNPGDEPDTRGDNPITGLANSFYVRGGVGGRAIDNSDALPYFYGGAYHRPPSPEGEQGVLLGFATGFIWEKGLSVELGVDLGPSRYFAPGGGSQRELPGAH